MLVIVVIGGCQPKVTSPSPETVLTSPSTTYPIQIIAVFSTYETGQTVNPGGPEIKMTLKNVADEPVVSLNVTLEEWGERSYDFVFSVSPSYPLEPGEEISSVRALIGGGWGESISYSLLVGGEMASGETFFLRGNLQIERNGRYKTDYQRDGKVFEIGVLEPLE